jgi:hypothetical protein
LILATNAMAASAELGWFIAYGPRIEGRFRARRISKIAYEDLVVCAAESLSPTAALLFFAREVKRFGLFLSVGH